MAHTCSKLVLFYYRFSCFYIAITGKLKLKSARIVDKGHSRMETIIFTLYCSTKIERELVIFIQKTLVLCMTLIQSNIE